jgi:hypothetical protein
MRQREFISLRGGSSGHMAPHDVRELRTTYSAVKETSPSPAGSHATKRHRSGAFATAALLYVSLMPVGWAESLTLDQQIAELKNSNGGSPVEIKQSQPDFLAGAYYLEVEVLAPYHPRFSNYVFRPSCRWDGPRA